MALMCVWLPENRVPLDQSTFSTPATRILFPGIMSSFIYKNQSTAILSRALSWMIHLEGTM